MAKMQTSGLVFLPWPSNLPGTLRCFISWFLGLGGTMPHGLGSFVTFNSYSWCHNHALFHGLPETHSCKPYMQNCKIKTIYSNKSNKLEDLAHQELRYWVLISLPIISHLLFTVDMIQSRFGCRLFHIFIHFSPILHVFFKMYKVSVWATQCLDKGMGSVLRCWTLT